MAITDEIYEHIVYDGKSHVSLASIGDMHERTVTVSGLSKTFSITGWRIGYAVAEKSLTTALRTVHDYLTVCAATPLQRAAVTALALPDSYYRRTRSHLRQEEAVHAQVAPGAGVLLLQTGGRILHTRRLLAG